MKHASHIKQEILCHYSSLRVLMLEEVAKFIILTQLQILNNVLTSARINLIRAISRL